MLDKILSGIFLIYLPVFLQEGPGRFAFWVQKNLGSLKISLLILVVLMGILLLWEAVAFAAAHRAAGVKSGAGGKSVLRVATSLASDIAPAEDPFKALMKSKTEEFGLGAEKATFTPVAVEEVKPELKGIISEPVVSSKIEAPPDIEKKGQERTVFTAREPEEESDPFKALLKSASSVSEDKIAAPKKEPKALELPKDSEGADPWKSLLKSAVTREPEKENKIIKVSPAEGIVEEKEDESHGLLHRPDPRQEPAAEDKEEVPTEKEKEEPLSEAPVSSAGIQPVKERRKFISLDDIEKSPVETGEEEEQKKVPVKKIEGKFLEIPAREDLSAPGPAGEKKESAPLDELTQKKMLELEGSLKKIKGGKENE